MKLFNSSRKLFYAKIITMKLNFMKHSPKCHIKQLENRKNKNLVYNTPYHTTGYQCPWSGHRHAHTRTRTRAHTHTHTHTCTHTNM